MQRVRLGRRTDVATWGIPHTRHLADARWCRLTQQRNASIRPNQSSGRSQQLL